MEFQAGSSGQEKRGLAQAEAFLGREKLLCEGLASVGVECTPQRSSGGRGGPQPLGTGSLEHEHEASRHSCF